jgi:hypothetical protein
VATPGGPHRFSRIFARARFENYQPFNRAVMTTGRTVADNAREGLPGNFAAL